MRTKKRKQSKLRKRNKTSSRKIQHTKSKNSPKTIIGGIDYKGKKSTLKINCSPVVEGKTVNKSTCYTADVLMEITDAYNKSHSRDEYIPWTNPEEIWRTLKTRLVNCDKEDCWLKEIRNTALENKLRELIFAPEHPPEWLKNPNEWLTDLDISKVMRQYETKYKQFKFIGPSPIDFDTKVERQQLPWAESGPSTDKVCVWKDLCSLSLSELLKNKKTKIGMVFNLDRYDEPGSHWVSLYVDLEDKSPFVFYFDSTGRPAPNEIDVLIKRIQTQGKELGGSPLDILSYNNNGKDHQKSNTECGMYSLFFIITMLTGELEDAKISGREAVGHRENSGERSSKEFENVQKVKLTREDKLVLFRDATIPDKYVELYRHKYFNF
jgi:hypothetical protein